MEKHDPRIARLKALRQVAAMVLDRDLAALHQAQRACDKTKSDIKKLGYEADPDAPFSAANERAALQYMQWADLQRAKLNAVLIRQTVVAIERKDKARIAFSRDAALDALARKLL